MHTARHFIAGRWIDVPGSALISRSPDDPNKVIYSGDLVPAHVDLAVAAAREALRPWNAMGREGRFAVLRTFAEISKARAADMAGVLADEVGKAMWECKAEAGLLAGKVDITLDAAAEGGLARVTDFGFAMTTSRSARCIFKPHGVMAVLGPFNFPAHLPNGHIIPALAMGNTVVFKPSDKAPAVGQLLIEFFAEALARHNAPPGVINLVQGTAAISEQLASSDGLDAIAFTGSWPVGKRILQANIDRPGRIIALELGGNNPAIVMEDADLKLAAIEIARSAFNTTGQRCTCTRRVIAHKAIADKLARLVCTIGSNIIIGRPRATHPVFMGPIISEAQRTAVLRFQTQAAKAGAEVLMESTGLATPGGDGSSPDGWYISPGVLKIDRFVASAAINPLANQPFEPGCDEEVFGPLLRISTADSLDDALIQANATRYGLAASIFTASATSAERFIAEVRAGCININTGTAGASSKLPFGGLGQSGNHRPAGSFALDYCAYPVASMTESSNAAALNEGMRFEDSWLTR